MTQPNPPKGTLAAGLCLATVAILLTHPIAVATTLLLALAYTYATNAHNQAPWLPKAALALALAVLLFNTLFAWTGATPLWQAPFRITLLGRPRITLEAITWGALAGTQLATTTLALGAATLTVPPETLHQGLVRLGAPRTWATSAMLALRMIPDTTRDAHAMRQALATRGIHTNGLTGATHTLIPLTARSLDRALLAEKSLRLRGYDPTHNPTNQGPLSLTAWLALAAILATLATTLLGPGRPPYYPTTTLPLDPLSLAWITACLLIPTALVTKVIASSR